MLLPLIFVLHYRYIYVTYCVKLNTKQPLFGNVAVDQRLLLSLEILNRFYNNKAFLDFRRFIGIIVFGDQDVDKDCRQRFL